MTRAACELGQKLNDSSLCCSCLPTSPPSQPSQGFCKGHFALRHLPVQQRERVTPMAKLSSLSIPPVASGPTTPPRCLYLLSSGVTPPVWGCQHQDLNICQKYQLSQSSLEMIPNPSMCRHSWAKLRQTTWAMDAGHSDLSPYVG